jgi:ATP-dependent Clp protease ATP-binding subunit ClpC
MFERFTDCSRKVIALANFEAQRFNYEYIEPEHILLGMVKEGSGVGAMVLKKLDVDIKKLRLEVEKLVKSHPDMVTMGKLPQTPRAKKVVEYAVEEASSFGHKYVATGDILLGLLRVTEGKEKEEVGIAAKILMDLGLQVEKVRREVLTFEGEEVPSIEQDTTMWKTPTPLTLLIDLGDTNVEELSELFVEISSLYRMIGGSGVNFTIVDAREPVIA